jgi:hypothetical protein
MDNWESILTNFLKLDKDKDTLIKKLECQVVKQQKFIEKLYGELDEFGWSAECPMREDFNG